MSETYTNSIGFQYQILTREEEQKLPNPMSTFLPGDYALYSHGSRMTVAWGTYEKCKAALDMLMTPSFF